MSRHLNPFDSEQSNQKIKIVNGIEIRPANLPLEKQNPNETLTLVFKDNEKIGTVKVQFKMELFEHFGKISRESMSILG